MFVNSVKTMGIRLSAAFCSAKLTAAGEVWGMAERVIWPHGLACLYGTSVWLIDHGSELTNGEMLGITAIWR